MNNGVYALLTFHFVVHEQTGFTFLLIIIKLVTYFDPIGSPLGLHNEGPMMTL